MPDWPLIFGGKLVAGGLSTLDLATADPDSAGVTVTAGAVNTKGAYVDLISAANNLIDSHGVWLYLYNSAGGRDWLVDIAIGPSGSEQVIVPNLLWAQSGTAVGNVAVVYLPIQIPSGVRVAIRCQSSVASGGISAFAIFQSGQGLHAQPLGRCTTYGAATADSGGLALTEPTVTHTLAAWTQIAASLTNPVKKMVVAIGSGTLDATRVAGLGLVSIGVGAAASEKIIVPALAIQRSTGSDMWAPTFHGPFDIEIPAGERLSARMQQSEVTAGDRAVDIAVYCFD